MNWRHFALIVVLGGIDAARSPAERKERIMLARQCGFLDDRDTEDWLWLAGLSKA